MTRSDKVLLAMRHSDRRVFSVQTVVALECAEKAQAAQELAHKGPPPPLKAHHAWLNQAAENRAALVTPPFGRQEAGSLEDNFNSIRAGPS